MDPYYLFLKQTIDKGIEAAKEDYDNPEQKLYLQGAIAGFEACRDKSPVELLEIHQAASRRASEAYVKRSRRYWYYRCYQMEVEWVLNVLSAGTQTQLLPNLPTVNGVRKAYEIMSTILQ